MKKSLKELGIRRLGLNDIIRVGDFQFTKGGDLCLYSVDEIKTNLPFVEATSWYFGKQICDEEIQNHGNNFYRFLNVKTQTNPKV